MGLNVKLIVVGGEVKTAEIKLKLPSTVGRGRSTTIMLPHPLVSRQHCELYEADGLLMVRDLGSLNGTFVNNQRIAEAVPIPPGELLTIGTVTFRAAYDLPEGASATPATSEIPTSSPTRRVAIEKTVPEKPAAEPAKTPESPFDFAAFEVGPVGQPGTESGSPSSNPATIDSGEFQPLDASDDGNGGLGSRPPLFQLASAPEPAKASGAKGPSAKAPAVKISAPIIAPPNSADDSQHTESLPDFTAAAEKVAEKPAAAPMAIPLVKTAVPAAQPVNPVPAAAAAKPAEKKPSPWDLPEADEAQAEEDDLNDFLKSLGK